MAVNCKVRVLTGHNGKAFRKNRNDLKRWLLTLSPESFYTE
jgi:hypothetical protein